MRSIVASIGGLLVAGGAPGADPPLGDRIAELSLPDAATGAPWSLAEDGRGARAVVVVFLGTECPLSNAYLPALARVSEDYEPKGVVVVGVNANAHDDPDAVADHAGRFGVPFPVLKDDSGELAERFRADRLPTAFVLDEDRVVRYRGRIDDQFERGVKRPEPTSPDLRDALDAVLDGEEVARPSTAVVGCPINRTGKERARDRVEGPTVTYSEHVSRIIRANCRGCHRPGEVGPFALMTYKDALAWSDAIREVVAERIMPPWNADPRHGRFANDRRLSDADREAVLAWVDGGCPEGDPADLPPPEDYVDGWGIGRPDEVIAMDEEFRVPAEAPKGGIPYQYLSAGEPFAEDRWVRAAEVRPGNRGVVHHVIVHVLGPGQTVAMLSGGVGIGGLLAAIGGADPKGQIPDQLIAFVPGDQAFVLPPGFAKRVPKGSRLVFEMHYTPNGRAGVDRSTLGLCYADGPPTHEVKGDAAINWAFSIPPRASSHRVSARFRFDRDVTLRSFNPHMHVRGRSFEYRLVLPDGTEDILLSVPNYDFNWQHTYVLAEPRAVPKGSRLVCEARFDNSEGNPSNPDPSRRVGWGDQTWDEMMIGSFEYYDSPADGGARR